MPSNAHHNKTTIATTMNQYRFNYQKVCRLKSRNGLYKDLHKNFLSLKMTCLLGGHSDMSSKLEVGDMQICKR